MLLLQLALINLALLPPNLDVPAAMESAVELQVQGKLEASAQLYRAVLRADPKHAYAKHNLGAIHHNSGDNELAAKLVSQAIALASGPEARSTFWNTLGVLYRAATRKQ